MKHTELLKLCKSNKDPVWKALTAVVQIHEPTPRLSKERPFAWCSGCLPNLKEYPCPTVAAIEENLK